MARRVLKVAAGLWVLVCVVALQLVVAKAVQPPVGKRQQDVEPMFRHPLGKLLWARHGGVSISEFVYT